MDSPKRRSPLRRALAYLRPSVAGCAAILLLTLVGAVASAVG